MNVLDIILIIFILIQFYLGYQKGFFVMMVNLLGYIAAAALTYLLFPFYKNVLINSFGLDDFISGFIIDKLKHLGANNVGSIVSASDLDAMQKLTMPDAVKESFRSYLTTNGSGMFDSVISLVSDFVVTVFAVVSLFLVALLVIKIIVSALNILSGLPGLSTINSLAGSILALIKTYIILSIAALVSVFLLTINNWETFANLVNGSLIADLLINHNVFTFILSNILADKI